jgi:hypothetical protein
MDSVAHSHDDELVKRTFKNLYLSNSFFRLIG